MAWITSAPGWNIPQLKIGDQIAQLPDQYFQGQKLREQADAAARQRAIYDAFKGGIPTGEDGSPDIDKAISMISPNDPATALKLAIDRENSKATLAYRQAQLAAAGNRNIPKGFEPDPEKPGAIRRMPGYEVTMTPTLQNNILKADESVVAGDTADDLLKRAQEVNPQAFSEIPFGGNTLAGNITAYDIPGLGAITAPYRETGKQTLNLKNIVTNQAISQLRLAFGGNPTEGERKVMLDLAGSVDLPVSVRSEIFQRARDLLKRRQDKNRSQSKGLRTGEYLAPGGGPGEASGEGGDGGAGAIPFDPSQIQSEDDLTVGQPYSFPDGSVMDWDGTNFVPPE